MQLSVLSALARLDVDPWQEAASLARLPGPTAAQRLASLIAALPDWSSARLDSSRLIALLPRRNLTTALRTTKPAGATTNSRTVIYMIVFLIFSLAVQSILATRHLPTPIDKTHASASTDPPKVPPPSFGP
jgi:hypothetical protein